MVLFQIIYIFNHCLLLPMEKRNFWYFWSQFIVVNMRNRVSLHIWMNPPQWNPPPNSSSISLQEMPANAKEEQERSSIAKSAPHINVPQSPGVRIPRFYRLYEHLTPAQLPPSHSTNPANDNQFEIMLGRGPDRGGEGSLVKSATKDRGQEDKGTRENEEYSSPHNLHRHPHYAQHDKILTNRDLVDTPLSPFSTKLLTIPEVQGMVSMTFSETPWETMEWLDLTPPSSATAFSIAPPSGSSIFNAEFLDVTDINLNSAMDLHLEHW